MDFGPADPREWSRLPGGGNNPLYSGPWISGLVNFDAMVIEFAK